MVMKLRKGSLYSLSLTDFSSITRGFTPSCGAINAVSHLLLRSRATLAEAAENARKSPKGSKPFGPNFLLPVLAVFRLV